MHHDTDSFFQSIAMQTQTEGIQTGPQLRTKICDCTLAMLEKHACHYPRKDIGPNQLLKKFQFIAKGEWTEDMRDITLHMLHDFLQLKIVVLHNHAKPQHIPKYGLQIDDNTIVIVQAYSEFLGSRFHGSKVERPKDIFGK